ncbi:MAG: AlpA family phage regulatory protein [Neisseria sp.]|nr:AlpA family phage regulatory protein [Neisseria sp.]
MTQTSRFIDAKEVMRLLGYKSRESLYRLLRANSRFFDADFPKPLKISTRQTRWIESEILQYQERLIERCRVNESVPLNGAKQRQASKAAREAQTA